MSQSMKNIILAVSIGIIIFLLLAIGYNLKIIPISINVSNNITTVQKQVDQLGIDFLGQIQIEKSKIKQLSENSFIVDSFANKVITDKVYSSIYEFTSTNKNCFEVTFVGNDRNIFFVYPPYASKRKGLSIASEYFNSFLTKDYLILPFVSANELKASDEMVLSYPVQKDGKTLGLMLLHYSGTSLISQMFSKVNLPVKNFVFVRQLNMVVYNVPAELSADNKLFSDLLFTVEQSNRAVGPVKIGKDKYYLFSTMVGDNGKHVLIFPANKIGTPLIVQIVVSFYLITIIILIAYVILSFFVNPKEETSHEKVSTYYKKPEYEEIKDQEEEEEFLSSVSSEEKKKDFFFEEVKPEKEIDEAFKSLVDEVSTKKSPLEVSLDEEYVFTPPAGLENEKLKVSEIPVEETKVEESTIEEAEFEMPTLENEKLPSIDEEVTLGGKEAEIESEVENAEKFSKSSLPSLEELEEISKDNENYEKIEDEFQLPEEVLNIEDEMKQLKEFEGDLDVEQNLTESQPEEIQISADLKEKKEKTPEAFEEELPPLEDLSEFSEEEKLPSLEELVEEDQKNVEVKEENVFDETAGFEQLPEIEEQEFEKEPAEGIELESEEKKEEFEIPPLEDLENLGNIEDTEMIIPETTGEAAEEKLEIGNIEEEAEIMPTEIVIEQKAEEEIPIEGIENKPVSEGTVDLDEFSSENIPSQEKESEGDFFNDKISDDISLSTEELEKVAASVSETDIENNFETPENISSDIFEEEKTEGADKSSGSITEDLDIPEFSDEDIGNLEGLDKENFTFSEPEEEQKKDIFDDLSNVNKEEALPDLPEDLETDIGLLEPSSDDELYSATQKIESKTTFDDICSSFSSKHNLDNIAFYRAEGDLFVCNGSSDERFHNISFSRDEPLIEKLINLRKDIFIPEGLNKFQPLLSKNRELFENSSSMYMKGIFDEGELLGIIFIFSNIGNEKDKEEYYHIASKVAEMVQ